MIHGHGTVTSGGEHAGNPERAEPGALNSEPATSLEGLDPKN